MVSTMKPLKEEVLDIGLAAYKKHTGHFITDNLKKNKALKSKYLLNR